MYESKIKTPEQKTAKDFSASKQEEDAVVASAPHHSIANIQRKANNTGLPDNLKSGIEQLSGHSMDDVKVHFNSSKPTQLQAHAYTQGTAIHVAPGQEKYLPHEAWHVVQQKQGRVRPTMQMKGRVNVNDEVELEREADVMGENALRRGKAVSGVLSVSDVDMRRTSVTEGGYSKSTAPIQARLAVGGDGDYRQRVSAHLQQLAAPGVRVGVHAETGEVTLHGEPAEEAHAQLPSHRLLSRMVAHQHTAHIQPLADGEAMRAEPQQPRSRGRAALDTVGDLYHWRPWGSTQQLRNRATAAIPQTGTGSVIHYGADLPDEHRQTWDENPETHIAERQAAPQHIALAHEMIHADRFQRGRGAFTAQGDMMTGTYNYNRARVGVDQEPAYIEEMSNVDVPSAPELDPRFGDLAERPTFRSAETRPQDPDAITENQIRGQFNLRRRVRYPFVG
jgi:uncharacterized protein DUF4157